MKTQQFIVQVATNIGINESNVETAICSYIEDRLHIESIAVEAHEIKDKEHQGAQ